MKLTTHLILPLILIPAFSLSAQFPLHRVMYGNHSKQPAPCLIIPSQCGGLLKMAESGNDSTVIGKVDIYNWRAPDWIRAMGFEVAYDAKGRMAGWNLYPVNDTSLIATTYEYDEARNIIAEIMVTKDSSSSGYSKTEAGTSYYCNDRFTSTIERPPSISVPYMEILPFRSAAFDSVRYFFSIWNPESGGMESSPPYKYSFSYEDSIVSVAFSSIKTGDEEYSTIANYRYTLTFNKDNRIEKVAYFEMGSGGEYGLTYLFTYGYEGGRLTSIVKNEQQSIYYYDLTYTYEGLIASYIEQYTSNLTLTRTNIMKVVFSYTTIPVASIRKIPSLPSCGSITATPMQGRLQITAPAGLHIDNVRQFDLQGRIISLFKAPRSRTEEPLIIPLWKNGSAISLLQVNTSRGSFTLKMNGCGR